MGWYGNYLFRRGIQLSIFDTIPVNHPVTLTIPSAILVDLNKVQYPSLVDVLVVYNDEPLATQVLEVGSDIQIQFNTHEELTVNSTGQYYLYYGDKNIEEGPVQPDLNFWPITIPSSSNTVTYRHPGIDWSNSETTTTGAKVTFVFSGIAVRTLAESGINDGITNFQVDNETTTNIDLYTNKITSFIPVGEFINLSPNYHTLRLINTGQRNSAARNTKLAISGFQYLGVVIATDLGEEITSLNWGTNTGGS